MTKTKCVHLDQSDEAYAVTEDGRETPIVVHLCTWAETHPASADKLLDVPRWLSRSALAGHMWKEGDCDGCPAYTAPAHMGEG